MGEVGGGGWGGGGKGDTLVAAVRNPAESAMSRARLAILIAATVTESTPANGCENGGGGRGFSREGERRAAATPRGGLYNTR